MSRKSHRSHARSRNYDTDEDLEPRQERIKSSPSTLYIKEFDPDIIMPNSKTMYDPNQGGSKIAVIGRPGFGKSFLVRYLLYAKKHIFPVGIVLSGSESSNQFYDKMFPPAFIFNELNEEKLKDFKRRQLIAKKHLENPWAVCILDDVTDDPSVLKKPLFQDYYKEGRHWKMFLILALQYCLDLKPSIRVCIDGAFLFREPSITVRKTLFENYAGIVGNFETFCELMDKLTDDHTALYIHNASTSNKLEDCVFYFKAPAVPDFKFGCQDYWDFSNERYNREYVEPL